MKIDLGCSRYKKPGFLGVDIDRVNGVEVIADARHLPFKTSSLDGIYSHHCIEHIDDQLAVIGELWRVCRSDSEVHLIVPHFSNPSYYDDLTHKHQYSTRTFEHYDKRMQALTGHSVYLKDVDLRLESARLNYWPSEIVSRKGWLKRTLLKCITGVLDLFANANPFLCERIWCGWVGGFFEVEYRFKVIK